MKRTHIGTRQVRRAQRTGWPAVISLVALLLTACGQANTAGQHTGHARAGHHAGLARLSAAGSRGRLTVLSASFTSASDGWLLAVPACVRDTRPCRVLLARKTTDGGATWAAVHAPPTVAAVLPRPRASAVSQILFTSRRAGWAWGPGLWDTRDGAATWHRATQPGGPVQSLAAGGGRMLLAAGRCGSSDRWQCRFQVYTVAARRHWRPIRGAAGRGTSAASVVVSGHTGYVIAGAADMGRPVLLAGPVDGSARWRPLRAPCRQAWSTALAAAPGGRLFLGCGGEPSAGSQLKTAYVSGDHGRTWHRVASPSSTGYLGAAAMTAAGTIFLSGGRTDVYISRDRGRSWHTSPSLAGAASLAGAGFDLLAATTSASSGYAIQAGTARHQIWITRDRGRRWTPVTVR